MITTDQCKAVVQENNMLSIDHHQCSLCGSMTRYEFRQETDVPANWQQKLGLDGPDDTVVFFNNSCGCNRLGGPILRSWYEFADTFNMQSKPEIRDAMWERFKAGDALIG